MSIEENKAIARRWNDIWMGDLAAIDELFAADFVFHYAAPGEEPDRDAYRDTVAWWLARFADVQATIEDIVAEGDRVAIRCTWRGTHQAEYLGIAPTGREVATTGISIIRIAGGKIVEEWGEMDSLGLMRKLGALPPPE
jgi:steroid delta-isomerase-like uncharacterized protein